MKTHLFAATLLALTAAGASQSLAQDVVVVPDTVDTYVTEQPYDDSVVIDGDVSVGQPLDQQVVIRKIPDNDDYAYAVVNKHRVIVQPSTRKIIKVYE